MKDEKVIHDTYSVCPVCLKRIPAKRVQVGEEVFLRKECPEHGNFSTVIWRGKYDMGDWVKGVEPINMSDSINCPEGCGLCPDHMQSTCCTLLEVTSRCNLCCSFCFADNKELPDPSLKQVCSWISQLTVPGKTFLQLSGGEPTVRDDLPEIIAFARSAGCKYIQLNSNGVRIAEDKEYAKSLARAGLSFVFLQFDGTNDDIYQNLRGKPLFDIKKQAILNCAEQNIGVTLVPTLVPGVNIDNIGEILRFAVKHSPAVRGVHFQPVSYFGKIPFLPDDQKRFTLDELLWQIEEQAGELVKMDSIKPSHCDHPLCGFHGNYIVTDGYLTPLSSRSREEKNCCCKTVTAEKNREFIGRRWQRHESAYCDGNIDIHSIDGFLERVRSHSFTITAMAFQDAGNIDIERLCHCSLHVFDRGRFVPFCVYYLSGWNNDEQ